MQKFASNKPIILLTILIVLTSILCSSETEIQSPKKIIEIPIETEALTATKTKIELPTLLFTPTNKPANTKAAVPSKTFIDLPTIGPSPSPWIYKSSTPRPTPLCYCNRDYDCVHFGTQRDAQVCFNYCRGSATNNWSNLDSDHDGVACEELP